MHGLLVDGTVIREPIERAKALAAGWAPVFAAKTFLADAADDFLSEHATPYDFSSVQPPEQNDYKEYIAKARHSGTGPDGIPYLAWFAGGDAAARTFDKLGQHIFAGNPVTLDFNQSLIAFPPKGCCEGDDEEVIRPPLDTRPIGLKNTDNKIIIGTSVHKFKRSMQINTHKNQRGFVPGRFLVHNALDLDSAGRILAMHAVKHNHSSDVLKKVLACLAFFDFAAAFPSMVHGWIFAVLGFQKFPRGVFNLIKTLYKNNGAFSTMTGQLVFLFW